MKVLSAIYNEQKNAGPKAPRDIDKILEEEYGAKNKSFLRTGNFKFKILLEFFKTMFSKEIIVLQYPLLYKESFYNLLNKNRTIVLIHDINALRRKDEKDLKKEINILKKFKYIIVHNDKMKEYLLAKGINKDNLYVLELFDYLAKGEINEKDISLNRDDISLLYPGNLKREKSPFVYQLDDNKINFKINLYGLGISENISNKLIYMGSFEPDNINGLIGDIGLIWDGNFDESDENNTFKNYTKYNNPHKLSCCMALGIPVIVWRKAAIAEFVKNNNVGYIVSSIYDINNIDFSDYELKRKNAINIGKKVRSGFYTKRIFNQILKNIEKNAKK